MLKMPGAILIRVLPLVGLVRDLTHVPWLAPTENPLRPMRGDYVLFPFGVHGLNALSSPFMGSASDGK